MERGRDPNRQMLDKASEDLIASCINDFDLTRERPSIAALFREVRRCFVDRQMPPPHYPTVQRRVQQLDARQAVSRREGSKEARQKFASVKISPLNSAPPLELIQIDHTLVDVIVVDEETPFRSVAPGAFIQYQI